MSLDQETTVRPVRALGISPHVVGNGAFQDEKNMIYACNNLLVRYSLQEKSGKVLVLVEDNRNKIDTFGFNIDRSYLAIGMSGPNARLSFFKMNPNNQYEHKSDIHFSQGSLGKIVSFDISATNNYAGVIIAEPHRVCVINLQQSILVLNVRFTYMHRTLTKKLHRVLFNPKNENVFLVIGEGVFREFRLKVNKKTFDWDVKYYTIGFHQSSYLNVTSACWLDLNRVIACTEDGRQFILEQGILRGVYNLKNTIEFPILLKPPFITVKKRVNWLKVLHRDNSELKKYSVTQHVVPYNAGFACLCSHFSILLFNLSAIKPRWYARSRILDMTLINPRGLYISPVHVVNFHAFPKGDVITCATSGTNIYLYNLKKRGDVVLPKRLANISAGCNDDGRIVCLSTCLWRPVCISLQPRTISLWHYNTGEVIASWPLPFQGRYVSLHPSGMLFCLTLEDNMGVFEIIHKSIHGPSSELNLLVFYKENFTHCVFSEEGAYLGGTSTRGMMYIFSSTTFHVMNVFEPKCLLYHSIIDEVNNLVISVGADGVVCKFDLLKGKLVWKYHNSSSFTQLGIAEDKKRGNIYSVNRNGSFSLIDGANKQITNFEMGLGRVESLAISKLSRVLLLGSAKGSVGFVRLSDVEKSGADESHQLCYQEIYLHQKSITQLLVTPTNKLITGSEDGSICISELEGPRYERYTCPHATTDLLLGSFTLLRDMASVREYKKAKLEDAEAYSGMVLTDKRAQLKQKYEKESAVLTQQISEQLEKAEKVKNYYKGAWKEMDEQMEKQTAKLTEVNNNFLYFNKHIRDKEHEDYVNFVRGKENLNMIDAAFNSFTEILDEAVDKLITKKVLFQDMAGTYERLDKRVTSKLQMAKAKIDRSVNEHRRFYIMARSICNGLQNMIMEKQQEYEAKNKSKDKNEALNEFLTFCKSFEEDYKILDEICKKFQRDISVRGKEVVERSYFDSGPTGISMKLLPNIVNTEAELEGIREKRKADMYNYLKSYPEQSAQLRRWDWIMKEAEKDYVKWFWLGQAGCVQAVHNTRKYHILKDTEKLNLLTPKQISYIHTCSAHLSAAKRCQKVVDQFRFECSKLKNSIQEKLSQIEDDFDNLPKEELIRKLWDIHNIIEAPGKVKKQFYSKKSPIKQHKSKTDVSRKFGFCPKSPFLRRVLKIKKEDLKLVF